LRGRFYEQKRDSLDKFENHQGILIMKSSKIKHLLCFTIIFLLFCAGNADAKNPLPEFFGVYALYNGKLVELQSHPQSQYAMMFYHSYQALHFRRGL
jgi:hypothetical protein